MYKHKYTKKNVCKNKYAKIFEHLLHVKNFCAKNLCKNFFVCLFLRRCILRHIFFVYLVKITI